METLVIGENINCGICGKHIKDNSQFIYGKYYHNDCLNNLMEENKKLKELLNDIAFDTWNDNVEFGLRYLAKIGYCDFDEEKLVYINKQDENPYFDEHILKERQADFLFIFQRFLIEEINKMEEAGESEDKLKIYYNMLGKVEKERKGRGKND